MFKSHPCTSPLGIGLRHPHYAEIIESKPPVGWLEVHAENFFHEGGASLATLLMIRDSYPISLHGVGLSIGSADGIDFDHLRRLKTLVDKVEPFLVSEHLAWNKLGAIHVPDLLPLPYTEESLRVVCDNVHQVQEYLNHAILLENPSSYLSYKASTMPEEEFLARVCHTTGASLLLDVNNVFVSTWNNGGSPIDYLQNLRASLGHDKVKEFHVAGHSQEIMEDGNVLCVDSHNTLVREEVWRLYGKAVELWGVHPTLLEWDKDIPSLDILLQEAQQAQRYWPKEL